MIPSMPNVPLFQLYEVERKWITRALLDRFPEHTRDLVIFAVAAARGSQAAKSSRACSTIAATAGCLTLRSTEIA